MQKCALYFGSFNPLHYGHLAIAEYVMQHCGIDRFVMVLSPHNPFKRVEDLEEPAKRYAALQEQIGRFNRALMHEAKVGAEETPAGIQSGTPGGESGCAHRPAGNTKCRKIELSDIEFRLSEPLYTINTLHEFQKTEPDTEFLLVVGADSFLSLPRWYHGEQILKEFRVIVYPRKGVEIENMAEKYGAIYLKDAPLNDISSTEIRNGLKPNRSFPEETPYNPEISTL